MSDYRAERIEKGRYFTGIRPLKSSRTTRNQYVIGFDSEAENGRPFLFQFSLPDTIDADAILYEIDPEPFEAIRVFMRFVHNYCTRKDTEYLIYGFNLQYEFTQLFQDLDDEVKLLDDFVIDYDLTAKGNANQVVAQYEIRIAQGKRHLLTIFNKKTRRSVRLYDGYAYYKTSLDNVAKMLGIPGKIDGVDRSDFTRADLHNEQFISYSKRDAWITRKVGEHIVGLHTQYDVKQTISAPHFASTVFRRHYLQTKIDLPAPDLEQAGLYSYHGGKNGFYLSKPTHLENIYQYDITSAYPEAMRQLPNIETASWEYTETYVPGVAAIWIVDLNYTRCLYRGMMNPDGSWPKSRYIKTAYLTSYELDEMILRGECAIDNARGWIMTGIRGGALQDYVDDFFKQKAETTGPERETAKLFLNSLYGKFFQKVPIGIVGSYDLETGKLITTDKDQEFDHRAGGLYHPPIASLITGFVRAKIHAMEHKYQALMTSTDGIFAYEPPDSSDVGKHLGGLTVQKGDLKIWRERLYIFREYGSDKPKAAFHGFRGRLEDLDAIPLTNARFEYEATQMVTMKLSTKALQGVRYQAGAFATQKYVLDLSRGKKAVSATNP